MESLNKQATYQSLQAMGMSARILRSTSSVDMLATGAPIALQKEPSRLQDDELRAMLNDSFVELTGYPMPLGMTLEEGHAALRKKTVALWHAVHKSDSALSLPADSPNKEVLQPRIPLRQGSLLTCLSPRLAKAPVEGIASDLAHGLSEQDWDETLISLLEASYREVTGRAIPSGMSHTEAEAQLRAITIQTWEEQGWETWEEQGWVQTITEEEGEEGSGRPDINVDAVGNTVLSELLAISSRLPAPPPARMAALDKEEKDALPTVRMTEFDDDTGDEMESPAFASAEDSATFEAIAAQHIKEEGVGDNVAADRKRLNNKRLATSKDLFRNQAGAFKTTSPKVYESWLTKKGPGLFKSDKRRWVVLHENGDLHYYTNSDLQDHKGVLSLKGLSASDCKLVNHNVGDVGTFAFTIKTALRLWHFSTDNQNQCKAWMKNLDKTITCLAQNDLREALDKELFWAKEFNSSPSSSGSSGNSAF